MRRGISTRWRRLQHSACEKHLIPSQTRYGRFILLGMGRSGSNLIRSALTSHPGVVMFNELFNDTRADHIAWAQPGFHTTAEDLDLRESDPVGFLARRVYRPMPPGVRAVGFKLFYYHAQDDGAPAWRALERWPDLRVIHLKRRQLLEAYTSLTIALKTGTWCQSAHRPVPQGLQVELSYPGCLDYFTRAVAWWQEFDRRFPQALQVNYEEVLSGYEREMTRIQHYLGLRPRALQALTRKQNRRPLPEVVRNYRELQTRFRDTPWAYLFDA